MLQAHANSLLENAIALKLDKSKEWLNLLHYKKTLLGSYRSEADTATFFLSSEGKYSPAEEMKASLIAISTPTKEFPDEHAQCRFPARTIFFKKMLPDFKESFKKICPLYETFVKKLSTKSVSIVFSSYYLNNPSSAFGHILMRFSKQQVSKEGESFELLDHAVNYAANVTTQNALLYAIMGMVGAFKGEFASLPYFYKVREYNDFESRDIWDYQLNLTDKEIEKLVAHVFEMRQTFFDYFYFTENCSYHMLGLLDAINPNWNLTSRNPSIVVPVDSIQTLFESNGLIRKVSFRPSKLREVKQRLKNLNDIEMAEFNKVISSENVIDLTKELSSKSQANILDAAIDFLDFKYAEEILLKEGHIKSIKRSFLIARSQIEYKSPPLNIVLPDKEQPQKGHKSRRLGVGYGQNKSEQQFYNLEYRATLHDLLDSNIGHNKNALIEMGHVKLKYYPRDGLQVDYASLFHVLSLSPIEKYFSNISWKAQLGYQKLNDHQCNNCGSPFAEFAGGLSYRFSKLLIYTMMKIEVEISNDFIEKGYRIGVGSESTILLRLGDRFSSLISSEYIHKYAKKNEWIYKYSAKMRMQYRSNKSIELDYTKQETDWKIASNLYFYF